MEFVENLNGDKIDDHNSARFAERRPLGSGSFGTVFSVCVVVAYPGVACVTDALRKEWRFAAAPKCRADGA